jgi:predicted HicB family RNase H-like nuclease
MAFQRTSTKDPRRVNVQMNVSVPWEYREQLREMAEEKGESFSQFVRLALMKQIPERRNSRSTSEAGATR